MWKMKLLRKSRTRDATSDEELVLLLKDGDKTAFVTLYERHKRYVYLFCVKMLGDADGAKDVTQGTFLKVLERHHQLADPGKFRSWLLMIARNDCISMIRNSRQTVSAEEYEADIANMAAEADQSLETEQKLQAVNQAISNLRPAYREVIVLREYQNLSYKQIAEVAGVAESTVKFRLFSARRELFQNLKPLLARLGS